MKIYLLLIITLLTNIQNINCQKNILKKGKWRAELAIQSSKALPFEIEIQKIKGKIQFVIINGDERITLNETDKLKDSLTYSFPVFNTKLRFKVLSKTEISGFWYNTTKKDYLIPFHAVFSKEPRFIGNLNKEYTNDFNGKWQANFKNNDTTSYPSLGIFKQDKNKLTGTFLTETGDYRYLSGNVYGANLYLSCFDGSHAFLFTGELKQDTINGQFYSGKHWETTWWANKNENFKLTSPDSLTYLINNQTKLNFTSRNLDNSVYTYPNQSLTNKVVIIQIMGTWCPNCMDESRYFKELFDKYHSQGLEIISVCYESGDDETLYADKIKHYKDKLDLDFTFLIGGKANKGLATEHFSELNEIISFPTSLFIDRNGNIQRIHTGFNGPSTGIYYTDYVTKTDDLIKQLLGL